MSLPTNPLNRKEAYLNAIATGNTVDMPAKPITREEAYLDAIAKNGGGSGGAENYAQLSGKPQINNVELESGNNSLSALGIASASAVDGIKDGQSINSFSAVENALANKVNVVEGKGLSTNDYDNTEKGKVADNTSAIEAIVNEYGAKNLYHNEYLQTSTWDNITITVNNADKSISFVGTNTTANDKVFYLSEITLPVGKYTISGGAPYSENANIFVRCQYNGAQHYIYDEDTTFDNESASVGIQPSVGVRAGKTVNFTLRFMIRDARITDPTYVSYAMTNRELTERVKSIYNHRSLLTAHGGTESINISAFYTGRPYLVMCSGNYNPLWRYMGLLCITDGSNGYLYDIVTDPTLTVSVSGNILTLINNNYDNDQVVTTVIMGG